MIDTQVYGMSEESVSTQCQTYCNNKDPNKNKFFAVRKVDIYFYKCRCIDMNMANVLGDANY